MRTLPVQPLLGRPALFNAAIWGDGTWARSSGLDYVERRIEHESSESIVAVLTLVVHDGVRPGAELPPGHREADRLGDEAAAARSRSPCSAHQTRPPARCPIHGPAGDNVDVGDREEGVVNAIPSAVADVVQDAEVDRYRLVRTERREGRQAVPVKELPTARVGIAPKAEHAERDGSRLRGRFAPDHPVWLMKTLCSATDNSRVL